MKVTIITPPSSDPDHLKMMIKHQTYDPFNIQHISLDGTESYGHEMNLAHKRVTGDLVMVMWPDDYYGPKYVEKRVAEFYTTQGLLFSSMGSLFCYDLPRRSYWTVSYAADWGGGFVYRREITRDVRYPRKTGHVHDDVRFYGNVRQRYHGRCASLSSHLPLMTVVSHATRIGRDVDRPRYSSSDGGWEVLRSKIDNPTCYQHYRSMVTLK